MSYTRKVAIWLQDLLFLLLNSYKSLIFQVIAWIYLQNIHLLYAVYMLNSNDKTDEKTGVITWFCICINNLWINCRCFFSGLFVVVYLLCITIIDWAQLETIDAVIAAINCDHLRHYRAVSTLTMNFTPFSSAISGFYQYAANGFPASNNGGGLVRRFFLLLHYCITSILHLYYNFLKFLTFL